MATILPDISTSLKEYRLLPGFTAENCIPEKISLQSPLCLQAEGFLDLQTPFISAAMQTVTGVELAIALAHLGSLYNLLPEYRARLKATLVTAGVTNLADFHAQAVLERISPAAKQDSGVYNMVYADNEPWVQ